MERDTYKVTVEIFVEIKDPDALRRAAQERLTYLGPPAEMPELIWDAERVVDCAGADSDTCFQLHLITEPNDMFPATLVDGIVSRTHVRLANPGESAGFDGDDAAVDD